LYATVDALGIVSMHPVTQGLPVHAVLRRRLATGPAIQNRRKRQESANLRRVPAPAGNRSKLRSRVVGSCDRQSCAHPLPLFCDSMPDAIESELRLFGNLEASVRSRDTDAVRSGRDLIEAGLN
jgi:hypothetical protein